MHQRLISALFPDDLQMIDAKIRGRGPSASFKNYILVFNGFWGLAPHAFEVVTWSRWERIRGDCWLSDLEVIETIDKWRAIRETETRLVEAIFQYNPDVR